MQEFGREERVGAELRKALAVLIRDEVKDPRVGMVTVQEVRVTRDLAHAKVYVTTMDEAQAKASVKALQGAAAFLRRRLGPEVKLRSVPQLQFVYDTSIDEGMRLSALIDKANAQNKTDPEELD